MIDSKTIKTRVEEILYLCQKANDLRIKNWGSPEQKKADNDFWNSIRNLDNEAKKSGTPVSSTMICLVPGRFVKWGINDGYARYIITKVGKKTCKLVHIPYGDEYHSSMVNDEEEAYTKDVERILEFEDELSEWIESIVIGHTKWRREFIINE